MMEVKGSVVNGDCNDETTSTTTTSLPSTAAIQNNPIGLAFETIEESKQINRRILSKTILKAKMKKRK